MANNNSPFGFRPTIRAGGAPFSVTEYGKPSGDSHAIFMFDLAIYNTLESMALPESPQGYNLPNAQTAYQATAGTSLYLGASLAYGAASTASVHPVTDEIDVIYLAQCKTGTTISTSSHVGLNANISLTTAGSTVTKQSGLAVDGGTINTTSTLDLNILKVAMISPNAEGDSAILEVRINKHQFAQGTAGA